MYYLALARKDYGEYEKAAEVYTEVLKLEKDPETYFLRGSVYLELDDQERAKMILTAPWKTAGTMACI